MPQGSREEWIRRAQRDRRRLASDGRTRYAVQVELVCEVSSLEKAWREDRPAGTMWLLPVRHGNRDCFRVLWGRFETLDGARRAKAHVPALFSTGGNRPAVVSVR